MRLKSFYNLFQATKTANVQTLPPFYDEDRELILAYYDYHCNRVGGKIDFAEFFRNMIQHPLRDVDFIKANPKYANEADVKFKKKKKPSKTA